MRVLVCGGRDFNDYPKVIDVLEDIKPSLIIHGAASGADTLGGMFAKGWSIPVEAYPADWKAHGKAAGPIRNKQMLVEGKPDLVVAFPGGRGTENMIKQATTAGVPVRRIS